MQDLVAYFGFGSLVNRHTLRTSFVDVIPARLKGWRRHWQGRTEALAEDVALLSIHQDPSCTIDGMIVIDRLENLPMVDQREAGYGRHALTLDDVELLEAVNLPERIYVYVAHKPDGDDAGGPLLQSYLDAVMQGFHDVYGDDGLQRFMDTTAGFRRDLIADRAAPLYPRSVVLDERQIEKFDDMLLQTGVVFSPGQAATGT
jgi:hypothetical protein